MSVYNGPEIPSNGLVFAYDMDNPQKSWRGRPVTNNFILPTVDVNGFNIQNNTFTRVRTGTFGGYDIQPTDYVWRFDFTTAVTCPYHGNDTTVSTGVRYTFSFDYYVSPDAPAGGYGSRNLQLANFEIAISGNVTDPTPSVVGVWKRAVFSGTTSSTNLRALLYPGGCNVTGGMSSSGFILFKNPQVEASAPGDQPSPFVAGTRSTTQAIVDLTSTYTVTANSLTYSSDGLFTLGSSGNDYISISSAALNGRTSWTVDFWMQRDITNSIDTFLTCGAGNDFLWFFEAGSLQYQNSASTSVTYPVTNGVPFHFAATGSGGLITVYKNGQVIGTMNNNTNITVTSTLGIVLGQEMDSPSGAFDANQSWKGRLFSCKFYNRVLSGSEVRDLFNAKKTRYGL
jgi:hypothetical protein